MARSSWPALAGAAVALIALMYVIFMWEFSRIEVQPGEVLVLVNMWGKSLPEDEIVAPDHSFQGVELDVLGPGRHFINPFFVARKKFPQVTVPTGQVLVLTRRFGKRISPERLLSGDILAKHDPKNPLEGERGIVGPVLTEGTYLLNPYAYSWELAEAVEIKAHQVGVQTLKIGRDPRDIAFDPERSLYVVPNGFRGVQEKPLPPAAHRFNPYVEAITPVDIRSHRVELRDILFPSRDGFMLNPQVVVEYAVIADKAPEALVRLADSGRLHQEDSTPEEIADNEILQKVLLPHIRGYARLEGSNFDARDFILSQKSSKAVGTPAALPADVAKPGGSDAATNAREALQQAMFEKIKPKCAELGVDLRAVTLAEFRLPAELSQQISERELARVDLERNLATVDQLKAAQELASKTALKEQAAAKVAVETKMLQAETKSQQQREVEKSRLEQELDNATVKLEAAKKDAEATLALGKADAEVINLQNAAEVAGLKAAISGFTSPREYAQYEVMAKMAPALTEIFTSEDSTIAQVFSRMLEGKADTAPATTARKDEPAGR